MLSHGNVDLDSIGNQLLQTLESLEVVLLSDVVRSRYDHASHKSTTVFNC